MGLKCFASPIAWLQVMHPAQSLAANIRLQYSRHCLCTCPTPAPHFVPPFSQALIDLYFFKEANPGVDIDTMLSSASATFKNFIMRGLYKVRCGHVGLAEG